METVIFVSGYGMQIRYVIYIFDTLLPHLKRVNEFQFAHDKFPHMLSEVCQADVWLLWFVFVRSQNM